jgi:hypothetical protein
MVMQLSAIEATGRSQDLWYRDELLRTPIGWRVRELDLLMKTAAETTLAIAVEPKRLSARIGITTVSTREARRLPIIRTCT